MSAKIDSMPSLDAAPSTDEPKAVSGKWNKRLNFKSRDAAAEIAIGGRLQWQLGYVSEDEDTQHQLGLSEPDFVALHRATLEMERTLYRRLQ